MKKIYIICCFLLIRLLIDGSLSATLSYSFTASVQTYSPITGGINIPSLSAGSDQTISPPISIGFNFLFDGVTYSQFQMSDNGFIHLGNNLTGTGYGNASGDVIMPNDFPGANTLRPFIAPLWEELAIAGLNGGGSASYKLTGSSPFRVLTIEWNKVSWRAPTGTDQVSFQIILSENSYVIDFIYKIGADAMGTFPTASIGICGNGNGNYYSLNHSGTNPTAGFGSNTTSIATPPATGQRYRWIPTASLPITLISFTGKNMQEGNLLEWKTAMELDNHFFTIERSQDAYFFEPIANIEGTGNSNTVKCYNLTDTSFPETTGVVYYRLKQTDFNRSIGYSPIISVELHSLQKTQPVFHYNKITAELIISYKFNHTGVYSIEVIDLSGHLVYRNSIEIISNEKMGKILLPFPDEGIYIARMLEPQGNPLIQAKFIK